MSCCPPKNEPCLPNEAGRYDLARREWTFPTHANRLRFGLLLVALKRG